MLFVLLIFLRFLRKRKCPFKYEDIAAFMRSIVLNFHYRNMKFNLKMYNNHGLFFFFIMKQTVFKRRLTTQNLDSL